MENGSMVKAMAKNILEMMSFFFLFPELFVQKGFPNGITWMPARSLGTLHPIGRDPALWIGTLFSLAFPLGPEKGPR